MLADFLAALFAADDQIEIRFLPPGAGRGADKLYFDAPGILADSFEDLVDRNDKQDMFFGVCPRATRGGTDDCVAIGRALFADFDHTTPEMAAERIQEEGLPNPTALVNSGHGTHAYWRLLNPLPAHEWRAAQKALARKVGSDPSVNNPSRIARVPGTVHVAKGDGARCDVVTISGDVVTIEAMDLPIEQQRQGAEPQHLGVMPDGCEFDLPEATRIFLDAGTGEGSRNNRLFQAACDMAGAGYSFARAKTQLLNAADRCSPPMDAEEAWAVITSAFRAPRSPHPDSLSDIDSVDWSDNANTPQATQAAHDPKPPAPAPNPVPPAEVVVEDKPTPDITGYQPFPVDELPAPLRDLANAAHESLGTDPAMVALPGLSVLAAAIGDTRRVLPVGDSWREVCALWTGVIAASGTSKSPALRLAWAPILEADTLGQKAAPLLLRQHRTAEAKHAKAEKMLVEGKEIPDHLPDPEIEEPPRKVLPRYVVDDATPEALAAVLGAWQRGILVARDELGSMFSTGRYGSSASAAVHEESAMLKLYDGDPVRIDRKSEAGSIFIDSTSVSVSGAVQPAVLDQVLSDRQVASGLWARFLIARPPAPVAHFTTSDVDRGAVQRWRDLVFALLSIQHECDQMVPPRRADGVTKMGPIYAGDVRFTDDATEVLRDYYEGHVRPAMKQLTDDNPLRAFLSKLGRGVVARLGLVLATCDEAAGCGIVRTVETQHAQSAVVLAAWFAGEAERVYTRMDADGGEEQLYEWLRQQHEDDPGRGVRWRDLWRSQRRRWPDTHRVTGKDRCRAALQRMADAGKITQTSSTGGNVYSVSGT